MPNRTAKAHVHAHVYMHVTRTRKKKMADSGRLDRRRLRHARQRQQVPAQHASAIADGPVPAPYRPSPATIYRLRTDALCTCLYARLHACSPRRLDRSPRRRAQPGLQILDAIS